MNDPWEHGSDVGARPPSGHSASRGGDDHDLIEMSDDAIVAERIRERELDRLQASRQAETATLYGTLVDLAEHRQLVTLHTSADRDHRGRLTTVARDHVRLSMADGKDVLLLTASITAVRPDPQARRYDARGDREVALDEELVEVLVHLVPTRPDLAVVLAGSGKLLHGRLTAVGEDVVTLRLVGDEYATYLPADAIIEVLL